MAWYMPQYLFECGALTIAMSKLVGQDGQKWARQLQADYERSYDDKELAQQWDVASDKLIEGLPRLFPEAQSPTQLASACKTLSKAVSYFDRSGKPRKRGWILKGTRFNGERLPVENRLGTLLADVALYHLLLMNGTISARELSQMK